MRDLAAALVAIGVEPGDRVALLSSTRGEWMEIDLAGLACGAVTVPIYIETGELTPSPKVKRKVFTGRFRREIEEMDA